MSEKRELTTIKKVEGMLENEADSLKMQSTLRNAIFGAISEEDVVEIVKRQVEKAKQGDPTALQFVMKYALGFGQPSVVKTVNVLATDVETAARIAKAAGGDS